MSIGQKIYKYETIDSTNTEAKRLGAEGAPHGSVVVADRQTAGRGRRGRTWESEKDGNLYFSLLLKPELPVEKASMLTLVMAQAVAESLQDCLGKTPEQESKSGGKEQHSHDANREGCAALIKWPNDIVIGGKKVVGILTELDLATGGQYRVIVGVGVNVVRQEFEPELAQKATSLEEVLCKLQKDTLLTQILKHFEKRYEQFVQDGNLAGMLEDYNARLVNRNQMVRVLEPGNEYEGLALGIDEAGELLVVPCGEDGKPDLKQIRKVYAGEVSVRGICGYV